MSPEKCGPNRKLPPNIVSAINVAYASCSKLIQTEKKKQMTQKEVRKRLAQCILPTGVQLDERHFVRQMVRDCAANVSGFGSSSKQEQRHIMWTTHNNLSIWFDTAEEEIIRYGFG